MSFSRVDEENFEDFFDLNVALAESEYLSPPNDDAKVRLKADAFSNNPKYEAFLIRVDRKAVGYAIVFETYSSFLVKPTLYLKDLYQNRVRSSKFEKK